MRRIVCLCGSTRFSKEYQEANLRETLAGNIVLTIGCDMKSDQALFAGKSEQELAVIKENLDALHRSKIELAWEVLILNVGGYLGESTKREIQWAMEQRKHIRWLEPQWVEVTTAQEYMGETIPVGAMGLLHPTGGLIYYPEYSEPPWRGFDNLDGGHRLITSEAKRNIYDVRELWLSECNDGWIKERNSPQDEKSER